MLEIWKIIFTVLSVIFFLLFLASYLRDWWRHRQTELARRAAVERFRNGEGPKIENMIFNWNFEDGDEASKDAKVKSDESEAEIEVETKEEPSDTKHISDKQ